MLALAYLAILMFAGDAIGRRWFSYVSWPHRVATAFLIGLPLGAWLSYLLAAGLGDIGDPLLVANVVAAALLGGLAWFLRRRPPSPIVRPTPPRTGRSAGWDRLVIGLLLLVVSWMMLLTYSFGEGRLGIAGGVWSDFGPTTAISQSFALGHNLPTEYPHFAGESIRYHFMFYFQVGNLTHLGIDPALALNVLSIGTMLAMLILLMALGERLFRSAAVGRIGAILFFLHGSLSFIPFLGRYGSIGQALDELPRLEPFVSSGFPWRGEEWGIWTQMVFLNQRHLAGALGMLLVIVLFLLDRLRPMGVEVAEGAEPPLPGPPLRARLSGRWSGATKRLRRTLARPGVVIRETLEDPALPGYVVCGLVAGMLPLWNGSIFVAAFALLGVWFVLFPNRPQMIVLAIAAAIPAIPQLLYVRPGTMAGEQAFPAFHWGYVLEDANLVNVASYLAFIFGPKLLLMAVALVRGSWRQWRVFIAFTSLVGVAFLIQLSVEVLANHKFINAWLIVANLFAAAGLVRLWNARAVLRLPARLVAVGLSLVIVTGGVIDFMPVKNQRAVEVAMDGDALFDWVRDQTDPGDVFLSDLFVVHPILLAGRRIYYGWPYYAWSAGYSVTEREREYRDLYGMRSPRELVRRLQADGIGYVAFDDGLRERGFVDQLNEDVYATHLEPVFRDTENRYGHLTIYRVPTDPGAWEALPGAPPVDMFTGGRGTDAGRFDSPRGLGLGPDGEILVADTQNHRIERFDAAGTYLAEFGSRGDGPGQFNEPNGVAVDSRGHVFVTDTLHHRVQEFDPTGAFVAEWGGAEPGFYGPRDVEVGPDDTLYVLDQGRARVVKRTATGEVSSFGTLGAGDGQLNDPTGFALAGERLYVADPANRRIVVFEAASGSFVRTIAMADWGAPLTYPDVAVEPDESAIYASVPSSGEIVVLDAEGTRTGTLEAVGGEAPKTPTALLRTAPGELLVLDFGSNRIVRVSAGRG